MFWDYYHGMGRVSTPYYVIMTVIDNKTAAVKEVGYHRKGRRDEIIEGRP